MNLHNVGWNTRFEKEFSSVAKDGQTPARVVTQHKYGYSVYTDSGTIPATLSGKFRHDALERSEWPAVGDWVVITLRQGEDQAIIHTTLSRRSFFSRRAPGEQTDEQVIVANIDTVLIVCGLDHDFSSRRIERYLTLVWEGGASPVLVLNKSDCCEDADARMSDLDAIAMGTPVHVISALEGSNIESIQAYLYEGNTVALLGSSGVGKSTLVNALLGSEQQKVSEIRGDDSKGRHTTSHRELFVIPEGGVLIDTPGMREIQLWSDEDSLDRTFADVGALAENCRFRDCDHRSEPGCAVLAALETGTLDSARYDSYLKLQRELAYLNRSQDQKAKIAEKTESKRLSRTIKRIYRDREKR